MTDFLDAETTTVAYGGASTAGTAVDWDVWAGNVKTAFADAAGVVADGVVADAVEAYASLWNPVVHGLAVQVEDLGSDVVGAAGDVTGADGDAAGTMDGVGAMVETANGNLLRPVNAGV